MRALLSLLILSTLLLGGADAQARHRHHRHRHAEAGAQAPCRTQACFNKNPLGRDEGGRPALPR